MQPLPPIPDDLLAKITDALGWSLIEREAAGQFGGEPFAIATGCPYWVPVHVHPIINLIQSPLSGPPVYNHYVTVFSQHGVPSYAPHNIEA